MKSLVTIIALLWLAGPLLRAEGAAIPIPITNFSFESPALSSGGAFTNNNTTPTPGWNFTGTSGVYKLPDPGSGSKNVAAPDGNQVSYFFRSTIWQQTSAQLTSGVPYQLTVAAAEDTGPVSFTYALYSGNDFATGTLLKSATVSPPALTLNFADVTFTFGPSDPNYATLLAAHAGENIIVAFTADNASSSSVDVDNVRLEMVPEPSTLPLLGVGGFLLWRKRRSSR